MTTKRKLSGAAVLGIVVLCVLAVCCSGIIVAVATGGKPRAGASTEATQAPLTSNPESAAEPSTKASAAAPAKPVKPVVKIDADTLVHVGEDVPAGTYRVPVSVDGDCYWMKSTDAEGGNIIANDIVQGGRPQVSLKAGQWFTSQRCGEWIKK